MNSENQNIIHLLKEKIQLVPLTLITFFTPILPVIFGVLFLIIVDFVLGVFAAKKQKIKLTSRRMFDTTIKYFIYVVIVLSSFVIESIFMFDYIPLTKLISLFFVLSELKSIIENAEIITEKPVFTLLKNKLRIWSKSAEKKMLNTNEIEDDVIDEPTVKPSKYRKPKPSKPNDINDDSDLEVN